MQAIDPPPTEARWRGPARLSQMPTWHLFDGHTDGNLIDGHPATASNSTAVMWPFLDLLLPRLDREGALAGVAGLGGTLLLHCCCCSSLPASPSPGS